MCSLKMNESMWPDKAGITQLVDRCPVSARRRDGAVHHGIAVHDTQGSSAARVLVLPMPWSAVEPRQQQGLSPLHSRHARGARDASPKQRSTRRT